MPHLSEEEVEVPRGPVLGPSSGIGLEFGCVRSRIRRQSRGEKGPGRLLGAGGLVPAAGAEPAGGPVPSTTAAPAKEKKVEAKKEESEESDDDMGFGLFD